MSPSVRPLRLRARVLLAEGAQPPVEAWLCEADDARAFAADAPDARTGAKGTLTLEDEQGALAVPVTWAGPDALLLDTPHPDFDALGVRAPGAWLTLRPRDADRPRLLAWLQAARQG
jgi:hypothetical protein